MLFVFVSWLVFSLACFGLGLLVYQAEYDDAPNKSEVLGIALTSAIFGVLFTSIYVGLVFTGMTFEVKSNPQPYVSVNEIPNIHQISCWENNFGSCTVSFFNDVETHAYHKELNVPLEFGKRIADKHTSNKYQAVTYIITKQKGKVLSCYVKE